MRESFLNKNSSVYSTNNETNFNLNLKQKGRLFPFESIQADIDRLQLYNEERDNSNNFRLIFTMNSICSNVLFNMRTEVVKNEGDTKNCKALVTDRDILQKEEYAVNSTQNVTRIQAIENTECSHPKIGKWVYHCGLDMFNNHRLRTNAFIHIGKVRNLNDSTETEFYNTIEDYKRDRNGDPIIETLIDGVSDEPTRAHVYQLDNVLRFEDAVQQNLIVRNGWYGFVNKSTIEIPNGRLAGLSINKIMNNNKACEVYNMYPDISLFSFVPKYNEFQNRNEYNWECILTYPYSSDENKFKEVNDGKDGIVFNKNGEVEINGEKYNWYETRLPHNLSVGNYVRLYEPDGKKFKRVRVDRVGNLNNENEDFIFMVKFNRTTPNCVYMKKDAEGVECKYYFRVFKKIRNVDGSELSKDFSRLAFGENVYGDRLAQLTFLDTVNLDHLLDNIGRPLSEIYLTILKTNRGWDKWYLNGVRNSQDISFSHCFGPVTAGLDLLTSTTHYNVHAISNTLNVQRANTIKSISQPQGNTAITVDDEYFYGDVVEFNPTTFEETTISKVYYRFNTAQREMYGDNWLYWYRNMLKDDYDTYDTSVGRKRGFEMEDYKSCSSYKPEGYFYQPHYKIQLHNLQEQASRFLAPVVKPLSGTTPVMTTSDEFLSYDGVDGTVIEGRQIVFPMKEYINEIVVSTNIESGWTLDIVYNKVDSNFGDGDIEIKNIKITAATDYDYYPGDVFGICKYNPNKQSESNVYWGTVSLVETVDVVEEEDGKDVVKSYPVLTIDVDNCPFDDISVDDEFALTDGTIPQYAIYNPIQQTFIWKDVVPPSETQSNMSTYNMPFSNGSFYIHNNITFFLRRQDPFNEYRLQDDFDYSSWDGYIGVSDYTEEQKRMGVGMTAKDKLAMNPNYLYIAMTTEKAIATKLLKFIATDITQNCL